MTRTPFNTLQAFVESSDLEDLMIDCGLMVMVEKLEDAVLKKAGKKTNNGSPIRQKKGKGCRPSSRF